MNWRVEIVCVNKFWRRKFKDKFIIIFERKGDLIVDLLSVHGSSVCLIVSFFNIDNKMSIVICAQLNIKSMFLFNFMPENIVDALSLLSKYLFRPFSLHIGNLFFWVANTKLTVWTFGNFNYGLIFDIRSIKVQRLVVLKLRMEREPVFQHYHVAAAV